MGSRDLFNTLKQLQGCTTQYNLQYPTWTMVLFVNLYVLLQAFGIPGPLLLSILAGRFTFQNSLNNTSPLHSPLQHRLLMAICESSSLDRFECDYWSHIMLLVEPVIESRLRREESVPRHVHQLQIQDPEQPGEPSVVHALSTLDSFAPQLVY